MKRLARATAFAFTLLGACAPVRDGSIAPNAPEQRAPNATAVASGQAPPAAPVLSDSRSAAAEVVEEADDEPFFMERDGRTLAGILSLPRRGLTQRGPGIVLVHGSGPLSRDGTMRGQLGLGFGFELKVYAELAEALRQAGYAVVRYDKRTCGPFNGCADNGYPTVPYALHGREFSSRALIEDALHAMRLLAVRPEIDRERLYFVGHSQGGGFVPELLTEVPEVRAGVMLAPPFNTADTLIGDQGRLLRVAMLAAGKPARLAKREANALRAAARQLARLRRGRHFGERILGEHPEVWQSWMEAAARAPDLATRLDRPLLVLGGNYDFNVRPEEIAAWHRLLRASARERGVAHRVRVLSCVTHALNCITEPDPRRVRAEHIGRRIAPELVSEIIEFLGEQSPPAAARELAGLKP